MHYETLQHHADPRRWQTFPIGCWFHPAHTMTAPVDQEMGIKSQFHSFDPPLNGGQLARH